MDVYLDNAATTRLDEEVLEAMLPYMTQFYGNPSSLHKYGRKAKAAIENVRKTMATLLNVAPSSLFFTSGGTEANNLALIGTLAQLAIGHVITSPIEHLCVLAPLAYLMKQGKIQCSYVRVNEKGQVCYDHLESLLKKNPRSLVSLMHANHEIGTINDIVRIGTLCKTHGAVFHCDTVQTIGHYEHNFHKLPLDLAVGSAHKLHGPPGIGFIYMSSGITLSPLMRGGAQERGMRSGTENLVGIVGLGKALEIAYRDRAKNHAYIQGLKDRMIASLQARIPGIAFHGTCTDATQSLYTLLSVGLPASENHDMLLFNLDIHHIAASAGSACSSGSQVGSHVLAAIGKDPMQGTVRFSFSKYNTPEEIDYAVEKLAAI